MNHLRGPESRENREGEKEGQGGNREKNKKILKGEKEGKEETPGQAQAGLLGREWKGSIGENPQEEEVKEVDVIEKKKGHRPERDRMYARNGLSERRLKKKILPVSQSCHGGTWRVEKNQGGIVTRI